MADHHDDPDPPLRGFWRVLWNVQLFTASEAVLLAVLEIVLLLAVLGLIGAGFGAFDVVWNGPAVPLGWYEVWEMAVFWNGFGVAVFLLTVGYQAYLLYALAPGGPGERWGWERFRLYFGQASVPLVLANLPALLPGLFPPSGETRPASEWSLWAGLYPVRAYFVLGSAAGVLAFVGLVDGVTGVGRWLTDPPAEPRSRAGRAVQAGAARVRPVLVRVRDRLRSLGAWMPRELAGLIRPTVTEVDRVRRQADGLFGTVLFIYAALVGYSLFDARPAAAWARLLLPVLAAAAAGLMLALPRAGTAVVAALTAVTVAVAAGADRTDRVAVPAAVTGAMLLVIRLAVWAWAVARRDHARGQRVGTWGVALAAVGLVAATLLHVTLTGGWAGAGGLLLVVPFVAGVAAVLVWALRPDQHTAIGVAYAAAGLFWAVLGGLTGALAGYARATAGGTVYPAALSVCLLFAVGGVLHGVLRFYAGRWYYPAHLGLAGGALLIASLRPYPHHLDELRAWYWRSSDKDAAPARAKPDLDRYPELRVAATAQLQDADVLAGWRAGLAGPAAAAAGPAAAPPPLVIVTTAGGASVSALFTFAALTELEAQIPGFHRHVRLVTGASGGMVGASAWRAWLTGLAGWEREHGPPTAADIRTLAGPWQRALGADFLSPIMQGMAFKDVPMSLVCPVGYWDDRGRRLERGWERRLREAAVEAFGDAGARTAFGDAPGGPGGPLDLTFARLREQEAGGRLPSLVFSPMMVEDGRPLLVGTLDLDYLAFKPYFDRPADRGPAAAAAGGWVVRPAGRTAAVEFLKLFPDDGWGLRLGTAARMNATFPYFTPAASLPTIPPRRVVDAGYLDNYGMAVALGWVHRHAVETNTLQAVARRVVVVELRPYGSWRDAPTTETERRTGGRVPPFTWPLQELTTPPEGGEAARKSGMVSRGNDQLAALADLLTYYRLDADDAAAWADPGEPFLIDVSVRGELESSLNWTLPPTERGRITAAVREAFAGAPGDAPESDERKRQRLFRAKNNHRELTTLFELFGRRPQPMPPP